MSRPYGGRKQPILWLALGSLLALGGCRSEVETTYGRSRGLSINGTNTLMQLVRDRGHTARAAIRYNETLGNWADVMIRFAPYPGPPSTDEAAWLDDWLKTRPGRKLIYIPQDYDAGPEFWPQMLAALPAGTSDAERTQVEQRLRQSKDWLDHLPDRPKQAASVVDWFGTEPSDPKKSQDVATCRSLGGPWAAGVDTKAAALPKHEVIRAENDETVFLSSDGGKLVIGWTSAVAADAVGEETSAGTSTGGVLIVANGSFLLNAALLNPARRPLAVRVVDWIGPRPGHVAFVEGANVLAENDPAHSTFHLLTVFPFNWIAAHLAGFGFLLALALAATIGRPRPEPGGEIERPSAHPVALGAILARSRPAAAALEILANYRRWRHPAGSAHRTESASTSPGRAPHA